MTTGRQFGREAMIYLAGFGAVGVIQFLALPIYSRVLGPAQYGLYSLALATTTALAGIMVVGGDVALARFWADTKSDEERRHLASTWIGFLTVWSIAIALVAAAVAPFVPWPNQDQATDFAGLFILGVAALVPSQLSRMLAQILRNNFRPFTYSVLLSVNALLDVGLGLAFVVGADLGVHGILLGILLGETIGSVLVLPFVRKFIGLRFDWSILPMLLRFGIPFIPASLAVWAMKSADRLVLGASATPTELGHYGFAVSLVAPFTVITMALGQAWIPRIAQLDVRDRPAAARGLSTAIGFSLAGFGAAAMLAGAVAPLLVVVLGGQQFAESGSVVPMLALGAAFTGVALFARTGLTLTKATTLIPVVTVAAAIIDVAVLLALVPPFGLVGAATAGAIANILLALLTLLFSNRHYALELPVRRLSIMLAAICAQVIACTIRPSEAIVWGVTAGCVALVGFLAAPSARAAWR